MHSTSYPAYFYAFIIPDSRKHGAQNFFRRLHNNFDSDQKALVIEEDRSFASNLLLIASFAKKRNLKIFTTVNSNKLGLAFKILHPTSTLVSRLGNTISQEIEKKTLKFFIHKLFYYFLILLSQNLIFQSKVMKDDFIGFFNFNKTNPKFLVIHNGVEISSNLSTDPDVLRLIDKSKVNFLLVGSFKHQKGYDIFFKALDGINVEFYDKIHFHVCGDGEEFQKFSSELLSSPIKECITLHGELDPTTFYQHLDIYILPSRFEGFSNSLIEALSFGLPSIVADCPSANKEVIIDKFNGLFFSNLNSEELLEKIIYMIENHAQFNKKEIIEDISERFSIRTIATSYKELFI